MKRNESLRTECTTFKNAVNDGNTYFPVHFLWLDVDLKYFECSHPDGNVVLSVLVNESIFFQCSHEVCSRVSEMFCLSSDSNPERPEYIVEWAVVPLTRHLRCRSILILLHLPTYLVLCITVTEAEWGSNGRLHHQVNKGLCPNSASFFLLYKEHNNKTGLWHCQHDFCSKVTWEI